MLFKIIIDESLNQNYNIDQDSPHIESCNTEFVTSTTPDFFTCHKALMILHSSNPVKVNGTGKYLRVC